MNYHYIYYNLISKIPYPYHENDVPIFNTHGQLIIALFEFRPIPEIKYVINAILQVYNSLEIGLAIVHGNQNKKYIEENFSKWKNILLINSNNLLNNELNISNNIFLSNKLWELFTPWQFTLIYNYDSLLFKKLPDLYFKYNYIRPFLEINQTNNTFSLINVNYILNYLSNSKNTITENFLFSDIPEERKINEEFAIETLYNDEPVWLYKSWNYIKDVNEWKKIIDNITTKLVTNKKYIRLNTEPFVSEDYFISKSNLMLYDKIKRLDCISLNNIIKYKSNTLIIGIHFHRVKDYLDFLINLNKNFVLITTGDVACFPYETFPPNSNLKIKYDKLLENKNLLKWYTKNPSIIHEKMVPLPLGAGFRKQTSAGLMQTDKNNIYHILHKCCLNAEANFYNTSVKNILIFYGAMNNETGSNIKIMGYKKHHNSRKIIFDQIKDKFGFSGKKNYNSYIQILLKSKFVISPPGAGIDTFRCWESLLCGAIPIMYHTPVDPILENLPVLLIDDYSILDEEFLNKQYEIIIKKKYDFSILYTDYWDKEFEKYN